MKIKAISISDRKGIRKKNIDSVMLVKNFGLENDAHGGKWHRQVSLLAQESIDTMRAKGLDVVAGNFAENITTLGIDLAELKVGERLKIGETELIISQLGKVCHHKCAIYHQAGDCVMPREGIFGVVVKDGRIQVDDDIAFLSGRSSSAAIVAHKEIENQHGESLLKTIQNGLEPAFVRFDHLKEEKNNLQEILNDLINLQEVNDIFIIDEPGDHAMAFIDYERLVQEPPIFTKKGSRICYLRSIAEADPVITALQKLNG